MRKIYGDNALGKLPDSRYAALDAQYAKEQEALRKREERKDRLHQNYLRRKANGKQKEYEDRIKIGKRRKREDKKAALRAEDMAKGVFYIAGSMPTQEPQKGTLPARTAI